MSHFVLIVFILYTLVVLFIGYYSSKQLYLNDDFAVANRRLTPLFLAGTLAATEIGIGSSLGVFEKAYGNWGLSSSWYVSSMAIAFIIISVFAPKFRKTEVKTVPEYFRRRYGKASGFFSSIIMILPLVVLTVIQFVAGGKILSILFKIDYKIAVTIIAVIVIAYTIMGGIWAVIRTDFLQIILIILGLFLAIPYSIRLCCNFSFAVKNIPFDTLNLFKGITPSTIISLIIMYIATFTVGQEVSGSFYSMKHSYDSTKGTILAAFLIIIFSFFPSFLGIITLALHNIGRIDSSIVFQDGVRYALPNLVINYMPPFIIGLLFIGLISAIMSSADSDILASGLIFTNDIYKIYLDKEADDKQLIKISRITMIMFGIIAYLLALFNSGSIIKVLIFVFSLRASGAFFPYILGLYWEKASSVGTFASLILGSLAFIILEIYKIRILGLESIIIALIVSGVSFVVFSKLYPPVIESLELIDEF